MVQVRRTNVTQSGGDEQSAYESFIVDPVTWTLKYVTIVQSRTWKRLNKFDHVQ